MFSVIFCDQTLETPLHYTARSGNEDILMEIVHFLGPAKTLAAVNKQAKVLSLRLLHVYQVQQ